MPFDFTKFLATAQKGVAFAEELLPFAKAIPGVAIVETAVKVASAIAETMRNAQDRAQEAGIVLSSNDEAEINAITDRLAAVNDTLMKYIDES